jgi:hypothetical protein
LTTAFKVRRTNIPDGQTPILTHCRAFIREGHDPATRLEVYQEHSEPDFIVGSIGIAAKLTVKEGDHAPRFAPYQPFPLEGGFPVRGKLAHVSSAIG